MVCHTDPGGVEVYIGIYRDLGRENGSYYLGFRVGTECLFITSGGTRWNQKLGCCEPQFSYHDNKEFIWHWLAGDETTRKLDAEQRHAPGNSYASEISHSASVILIELLAAPSPPIP